MSSGRYSTNQAAVIMSVTRILWKMGLTSKMASAYYSGQPHDFLKYSFTW